MRHTFTAIAFAVLAAGEAFAGQAAPEKCIPLYADMQFCGSGWQQVKDRTPEGIMLWKKGSVVAKVIMEAHRPGTAPEAEKVMEAIKQSVRNTLKDPNDVAFDEHSIIDGEVLDRGIIAYDLDFGSYVPRIHHSFFLGQEAMLQFLTYTSGGIEKDALSAHLDFVRAFEFKEVEEEIKFVR